MINRPQYRYYYPRLRPFIRKYTDSVLETEEILQETFIRVWLSRDKLPGIENLHAWVFKIASHAYLSALRKKLRYREKIDFLTRNQNLKEEETSLFGLVN